VQFDFADWEAVQPGSDAPVYLPATPETVRWGRLFCAADAPVLTVEPGTAVTVDTVSHEGVLPDQGQDPVAFFGRHGVPEALVLQDAVALAARGRGGRRTGPTSSSGPSPWRARSPGTCCASTCWTSSPACPTG
jgi:hypothetical protein